MRISLRRLTTFAALAALLTAGHAAAQETYDLRGPTPGEGMTVTTSSKMTMEDGEITLTVMGMNIDGTMSSKADRKDVRKILGVEGGQVTKVETKMLEGETTQTISILPTPQTEKLPLVGSTVISERTESGWKHSLVDQVANAKQTLALEMLTPVPDYAAIYPEGKVAPGHTWEVKAEAWSKATSNMELKDVAGQVKAKFVKVAEYKGEQCAVIEQDVEVKGKVPVPGGGELDMSFNGTATTHRSLKSGLDLKTRFEGEMAMEGSMEQLGQKIEMSMSGKVTVDEGAELK